MTAPLRRALLCLLVAALALLAHAPLFGSGFVGGDLELLAEAATPETLVEPASAWLARGEIRPIPAAVLRAHAALHTGLSPLEPAVAAPYFAFTLAALLVAAAGAGVTLRRVLVPWLGESAARAAGWACAGLIVAHPASVPAIARPMALGDLLALAAGTWCTAFFLRGRQQRRDRFLVFAALLAIAAGFASSAAWLLPFACAVLEFTSAHRPRVFGRRFAAAATVALVAVVAVAIEAGFAWSRGFGWRDGTPLGVYANGFARETDPLLAAYDRGFDPVAALNALGVLFVPVPSPGAAVAFFACGALLLLAAEPLLRAVRAAPRLWGWLVLGWLGSAAIALLLTRELAVPPGRVELGVALLPATVVVCVALATASTALGGSRRTVIPLAIAAGFCILSDRTARIWLARSEWMLTLRSDFERALSVAGANGTVAVVRARPDLDRTPAAHELRRLGPGSTFDPDLVAGTWPRAAGISRIWMTDAVSLPYTARRPSSVEDLRRGLAVLLMEHELRPVVKLSQPRADAANPIDWSDDGRSDLLELDPIALTMVRVKPRVGISTAEPPRMYWRATNTIFENGSITGAWVASEDGPQAVFDLGRSLEWLLGGTIRRIWFDGELRKMVKAYVLTRIPVDGVDAYGGDLVFDVPEDRRPRPWTGDASWHLVALDGYVDEAPALPSEGAEDRFLHFASRWGWCQVGQPSAFVLECRAGDVTIARSPTFERD